MCTASPYTNPPPTLPFSSFIVASFQLLQRINEDSMQHIGALKAAASGGKLGASFQAEFGYLPEYSCRLEYDQMPDYVGKAVYLNKWVGGNDAEGPLDWRYPSSRSIMVLRLLTMKMSLKVIMRVSNECNDKENLANSYFNWDIAD